MKSITVKSIISFLKLGVIFSFLFIACKGQQKAAGQAGKAEDKNSADSLFAAIERTPCFGRCPTYVISIYKSGYVVYQAKQWVKDSGIFYTFISQKQLSDISAMAEKIGFAGMQDTYHDPKIMDAPTTFISYRVNGKIKRIDDTYGDTPASLTEFEKYIDGIFSETKWKKLNNKN
jgi:hypothetical protein